MSDNKQWNELTPDEQIERLRFAVETLCSWLVEAQTGFGKHDAWAIQNYINEGRLSSE